MKVKCSKCGYEWNYKGMSFWACCPKCQNKTKIKEITTKQN